MTWTLAPLFGIHPPMTWFLLAGVLAVILVSVVVLVLMDKRTPSKPVSRRRRRSRA
jgi:hypothetical protein